MKFFFMIEHNNYLCCTVFEKSHQKHTLEIGKRKKLMTMQFNY